MKKNLRIVMAQLNLTVGDIAGNLAKHIEAARQARDELHADIIVFPELSLTGYPPDDLLYRKSFLIQVEQALNEFINATSDIYCIVGYPMREATGIYNTCALTYNGKILEKFTKQHLPNYGVFDEMRYFLPGKSSAVVNIHGVSLSVIICEDIWYARPANSANLEGAQLIIVPNASPYEINKHDKRKEITAERAQKTQCPIIYVNCVGGQDDLIFDGGSFAVDQNGDICQQALYFEECLHPVDITVEPALTIQKSSIKKLTDEEKIYKALVLGVKDYLVKNGFRGALLGLSGGIDSALTLAIAVDAIGAENVTAIMMPSEHTAQISLEDAEQIAKNFGVNYQIIPIIETYKAFSETLKLDNNSDITAQNLQARCRGTILMALSNKTGDIVLTTGNRSELAVGYATLYGDMAGGFGVLKDIYKTLVYKLANYRNTLKPQIPERIITRPPTAELAPNQLDADTLPPYEILDPILYMYLNQEKSREDIVEAGYDLNTVNKVIKLIYQNEYKRRQAPIGVRIDHRAFGRDRRYPTTTGFKG